MKELNDEIKLTINLMQTDIEEGAHGELQYHLKSLLEIKLNELQRRLVERSWAEPVTHDKAPYKSVQIKPLTDDELKSGGWWCDDVSEECRLAFESKGISSQSDSWVRNTQFESCYLDSDTVKRSHHPESEFLQIQRVGNDFYWSEECKLEMAHLIAAE